MKRQRVNVMGIRTTTRVQEKNIIKRAKHLGKNPELIIPDCTHGSICPFEKVRKEVQRIQDVKDDEGRLKKMSGKGTQLARAYAAFIAVGETDKIPYLAAANLPTGTITYVMKNKIKKDVQIGVQHYDEPELRLLAVRQLAQKFKVWVFSTDKKMFCTGRECSPPSEFVPEVLRSLKYRYNKSGKNYHCQDLSPKDLEEGKLPSATHLLLDWKEAGIRIAVCERCAGKEKNLLGALVGRIAGRSAVNGFAIRPRLGFVCRSDCNDCTGGSEADSELLDKYKARAISDRELLDGFKSAALEDFEAYALGNECFGKDLQAMVAEMEATDDEKAAVKYILDRGGPKAFPGNATPNKILAENWEDHGLELLKEMAGSDEIAVELHSGVVDGNYYQAVVEAGNRAKESHVLSSLPDFVGLSKLAEFADSIAKTYKGRGKEEALAFLQRASPKDTKVKTFKFAFLDAMGEAKGIEWKFTNTERDFGSFLKQYAEQLLQCEPDKYAETLKSLLSVSGNDEELEMA
jgi:hypothetical protein